MLGRPGCRRGAASTAERTIAHTIAHGPLFEKLKFSKKAARTPRAGMVDEIGKRWATRVAASLLGSFGRSGPRAPESSPALRLRGRHHRLASPACKPKNGGSVAGIEVKSFDSPDETRPFEGKGKADVLQLGGHTVGRATFEPGWKWSNNVKPIAGTDSCQISHLGYCVSGRMKVYMDDGSEQEIK